MIQKKNQNFNKPNLTLSYTKELRNLKLTRLKDVFSENTF